ncbi:hypothetical protein ACAW74_16865 [Fibrella sp. WM1]|uniref:hypothetical protein n=1 Tax=Fibrella musci TaxID=3242485 RepID=UPI00351FFD55
MEHKIYPVRVTIKLPDKVLFSDEYANSGSHFAFSQTYVAQASRYFLLTKSLPDKGESRTLFWQLYTVAKETSSQRPNDYHVVYRAVFDSVSADVNTFIERLSTSSCTALPNPLPNLFNRLYVYLSADEQEKFISRLLQETNGQVEAYVSTAQLVDGGGVDTPDTPIDSYQARMNLPEGWNRASQGGLGTAANCFLIEDAWDVTDNVSDTFRYEFPSYVRLKQARNNGRESLSIMPPNPLATGEHGRKTLSVLLASHQVVIAPDRKGIVPDLTIRRLISGYVDEAQPSGPTTHSQGCIPEAALLKAIAQAANGDIILIEYELTESYSPLPLEVNPDVFLLMRIASNCLGISVIEPAGNRISCRNLDKVTRFEPDRNLDSGAILAGVSTYIQANQRNISPRAVEQHRMCFVPVPIQTVGRQMFYKQTSAAAAVIAGVACMIQSLHKTVTGQPLSPLELRKLLCDPENGTPAITGLQSAGQNVGSIPDVKRIIQTLKRRGAPIL